MRPCLHSALPLSGRAGVRPEDFAFAGGGLVGTDHRPGPGVGEAFRASLLVR